MHKNTRDPVSLLKVFSKRKENNGPKFDWKKEKKNISSDSIIPSFLQLSLRRNSRLSSSGIEREIVESWFHGWGCRCWPQRGKEGDVEKMAGFLSAKQVYETFISARLAIHQPYQRDSRWQLFVRVLVARKSRGQQDQRIRFVNELPDASVHRPTRNWPSAGLARDHE